MSDTGEVNEPMEPMQPVAPAATATPPSATDDYFNSSRMRVIAMITAGVVAVGALGALGGVVFDPPESDKTKRVDFGTSQAVGAPGNSVAHRSLRTDGTSPTPVGTIGTTETTETTDPVPEPTDPVPPPTDGGEGITLANGVQIYVPPGWQVDYQDDMQANFSDGQGNWAFAYSAGAVDPSGDASGLITANMQGLLPTEYYTQLQTSEFFAIQPFGSLVSAAGMDYEALWTDGQGAVSLHGQIYAGIRQDGVPLIMLVEHTPVEDWDNGFDQVSGTVNATFGRFAGVA